MVLYSPYEKKDPVQALRRKIRSGQGGHPALSSDLRELLAAQYRQHPNWSYWSYQLHADNLAVLIEKEPTLGTNHSYWPKEPKSSLTVCVRLSKSEPYPGL